MFFMCSALFGVIRKTELKVTCSVRFRQNGKTLLRSVTTITYLYLFTVRICIIVTEKCNCAAFKSTHIFTAGVPPRILGR